MVAEKVVEGKSKSGGKEADKAKDKEEKKTDVKKDELTEEDKKLQDELNMLVERLSVSRRCVAAGEAGAQEPDEALYGAALETMRSLMRSATTSMTSVPKPLKFMLPHYDTMKCIFEKIHDPLTKRFCADLISVLAMTSEAAADCVNYRLLGRKEPVGDWGHEYVRHVARELAEEWRDTADETRRAALLSLAREVVEHNMAHNGEVEACDLLMEMDRLDLLLEYVADEPARVCHYLLACVPYAPVGENTVLLLTALKLYLKFDRQLEALRCALMLNDLDQIKSVFLQCPDRLTRKQMAMLLGRHQVFVDIPDDTEDCAELAEYNSNSNLFRYFHSLARELDIMDAKTPEEIYKTHLEPVRHFATTAAPDSARMNLAASFVNGFVNMGFGVDKMMADSEEANKWFYKNKEYGMMSAAASQGLIYRWDIDNGLAKCDAFLYVNDEYIKAGTMMAIGIISCGIQDEVDPAAALLKDYVHSENAVMRVGSILGLGLAYSNSKRATVWDESDDGVVSELRKVLVDSRPSATMEVKGLTAVALGLIGVGSADSQVASDLLQFLMEAPEEQLTSEPNYRFIALGIALLFLGKQEQCEVLLESVRALPNAAFSSMAATLLEVCAYAGTGNVLKIQQLFHVASEHYDQPKDEKDAKKDDKDKKKKDEAKDNRSAQQAVAVLGAALIGMGEDIGTSMCFRMCGQLFRYGEPAIKRAVPLALALLSVSNPQLSFLETLSKFSHDADAETAYNSIFALGLVGAGTNNARLGGMLRQLASYHQKDPLSLMLVRIAQGLNHVGKGTVSLNPFHSDRQLMCAASVAGLVTTCFAFLDAKNTVLNNRQHYLLYCLVPAMQPRLLITLTAEHGGGADEQLKQENVAVRVGQAVDVVGQTGKPKTITGFQTQTTPVLLGYGERAELAVDDYDALTPYLEGLVILKKKTVADKS